MLKRFFKYIILCFLCSTYLSIEAKTLTIGHRGACGYEPENTPLSFKKALDIGVDMIELDVYQCKSGQLIVIHDKELDRTTDGNGLAVNFTLEELKRLDAGKGEKIPTLTESFDLISGKAKIAIELKGVNTAIPTVNLIEKYVKEKIRSYDDFLVISFNHKLIFDVRKLNSKIPIGFLFKDIPTNLSINTDLNGASFVGISHEHITKTFIEEMHKAGIRVFVYTVNTCNEINKMKVLLVDAICSDYPDLI